MTRRGVKLWEIEPGEFTMGGDALACEMVETEARALLADYHRTGNGSHAWRAWRCARLLPSVPSDLQADLLAFIDGVARGMVHADGAGAAAQAARMSAPSGARGEGNASAGEQSADRDLLTRYEHLIRLAERNGTKPNKTAIRRRLAVETGAPSEGAIRQRLIRTKKL